ncbi:MAG: NUDIX domain-containing protein [Patescibacteria group bacterium]
MKTLQATLVITKPDVPERNLTSALHQLFKTYGLIAVAETMVEADLPFIKKLYDWQEVEYPRHIDRYLCTSQLHVSLMVSETAISKALELKKEFRSQYQLTGDRLHTLIHCSDSPQVFSREFRVINERFPFAFREPLQRGRASQVQVIPYVELPVGRMVLLMHRSQKKGDFWQVVTGGVNPGEDVALAGFREMYEETKLMPTELSGPIYAYDFTESTGTLHEDVFTARLSECYAPVLSDEHTEFQWVDSSKAHTMLKWPGNKTAMEAFIALGKAS